MYRLVAITLFVLPLAFAGTAQAGRFPDGLKVANVPTSIRGTSSQVSPPSFTFPGECAPKPAFHHHGPHHNSQQTGNEEIAPCAQ